MPESVASCGCSITYGLNKKTYSTIQTEYVLVDKKYAVNKKNCIKNLQVAML